MILGNHLAQTATRVSIVKSIQEQQREITSARQQNADLRYAVQALQDQAAAFKAENDALRHSLEVLSEQVRAAR
jgi:hypothetical protein